MDILALREREDLRRLQRKAIFDAWGTLVSLSIRKVRRFYEQLKRETYLSRLKTLPISGLYLYNLSLPVG